MPVLDHFRPPLSAQHHWQSFHAGWASALAEPATSYPIGDHPSLYVVAYRPVVREQGAQFDVWPHQVGVGDELPEVPLYLNVELAVPIESEVTYQETCQKHRIAFE